MKRACSAVMIVAVATLLFSGEVFSQTPSGRWATSAGVVQSGDATEPIAGALGFEVTGWYVMTENFDVGVRISSIAFDSSGLEFAEVPHLMPGTGTIGIADFAFRWYPLGSDGAFFPFVGLSAGFVFVSDFSADKVEIPDLGIILDTDWEADSFGYGAEIGIRYDLVGDRWFIEAGFRYFILGAESTGTLEVVPTITRSRLVETGLDSYRIAIHFGRYF